MFQNIVDRYKGAEKQSNSENSHGPIVVLCSNGDMGQGFARWLGGDVQDVVCYHLDPVNMGDRSYAHQVRADLQEMNARAIIPRFLVRGRDAIQAKHNVTNFMKLYKSLARDYPVCDDPKTWFAWINKCDAHQLMQKEEVPVPQTTLLRRIYNPDIPAAIQEMKDKYGADEVIIKPSFGVGGMGVAVLAEREIAVQHKEAKDVVEELKDILLFDIDMLLQRRIRTHETGSESLRAVVVGDKVVLANKYTHPESIKSNPTTKEDFHMTTLSPQQEDMAVRASQALGLGFSGVDLLVDKETNETFVSEVNASPGGLRFWLECGFDTGGVRDALRGLIDQKVQAFSKASVYEK